MSQRIRYLLKKLTASGKAEYVKEIGRSETFTQSFDNAQRYTKEEIVTIISKRTDLIVVEETMTYRDVVVKISIDPVVDTISIKDEDEKCWMN